jgi:hypothetical protein
MSNIITVELPHDMLSEPEGEEEQQLKHCSVLG